MTSTKKSHSLLARRWRLAGFTLVELLVVIAIIAILAAILTPAIRGTLQGAQERRARMEIASIVSASQSYYSEYGVYPSAHNGEPDRTYHAAGGNENAAFAQARVIRILRGIDTNYNRRAISFLEVKDSSLIGTDKDGNNYTADQNFFLDPWGNPYIIAFDTNFDENVELETLGGWRPTNRLERTRIAVYSLGPRALTQAEWGDLPSARKQDSAIVSWR